MCGIFAVLNNVNSRETIKKNFNKGKNRGPENSILVDVNDNTVLGFHRLAINGYNDITAEQPFNIDGIYLICNGEIYNHKQLFSMMNITPISRSDCEVIIYLYKKYGIKQTLQMLDGVFAFLLYDTNKNTIYAARDSFGVRPLFIKSFYVSGQHSYIPNEVFVISSVIKSMVELGSNKNIKQVKPGTYLTFKSSHENYFRLTSFNTIFNNNVAIPSSFSAYTKKEEDIAISKIRDSLINAVLKRVDNTEREIACLLSGGLDSSLIAALVTKYSNRKISTWSIGMPGSEDLKYAKIVADHIGSNHHEIVLSEEEFLSAIERVIYKIESYDTTTVRASVGNWLISKYIRENSDCKVIFNGDGSDEVCGGYMYFHCAPDSIDFDKECRRLLNDIHYFDVLRSDRSISSNGLEARTPFLDRHFVDTYMSINPNLRHHAANSQCEKYLLRKAFDYDDILPKCVLWRTKEAFSDGVSSHKRSWFETIKEHIDITIFNGKGDSILSRQQQYYQYNVPQTLEQLHYRMIYESYFKSDTGHLVPYFWMPKFVNATDASARTLNIYKNKMNILNDNPRNNTLDNNKVESENVVVEM